MKKDDDSGTDVTQRGSSAAGSGPSISHPAMPTRFLFVDPKDEKSMRSARTHMMRDYATETGTGIEGS
jgi:hypothetical protein